MEVLILERSRLLLWTPTPSIEMFDRGERHEVDLMDHSLSMVQFGLM